MIWEIHLMTPIAITAAPNNAIVIPPTIIARLLINFLKYRSVNSNSVAIAFLNSACTSLSANRGFSLSGNAFA
jgi:hypothetical protein